jgi:exodeoxyribonuclease V gamma subunit
MRMFAALSRRVQVNLFLLEPCQEFWGYISSAQEQEKALKKQGKGASAAAELHLEPDNRLLATMGQLGRDFGTWCRTRENGRKRTRPCSWIPASTPC